jgi:hypothetical protein
MSNVIKLPTRTSPAKSEEPFASFILRCAPTPGYAGLAPERIQPVLGLLVNIDKLTVTYLAALIGHVRRTETQLEHALPNGGIEMTVPCRFAKAVIAAYDMDGLHFLQLLDRGPVGYTDDVLPLATLPGIDGSVTVDVDGFYFTTKLSDVESYTSARMDLHSVQLAMSIR